MSRQKALAIRSELHTIEFSFRGDHSDVAEWERDLLSVACCDLWNGNLKKLVCRLRRLLASPVRAERYAGVIAMI